MGGFSDLDLRERESELPSYNNYNDLHLYQPGFAWGSAATGTQLRSARLPENHRQYNPHNQSAALITSLSSSMYHVFVIQIMYRALPDIGADARRL